MGFGWWTHYTVFGLTFGWLEETAPYTDDLLINNYENLSKSWIASMLQIEESEIDAMHDLRMKFLIKTKGEEFAKNFAKQ